MCPVQVIRTHPMWEEQMQGMDKKDQEHLGIITEVPMEQPMKIREGTPVEM